MDAIITNTQRSLNSAAFTNRSPSAFFEGTARNGDQVGCQASARQKVNVPTIALCWAAAIIGCAANMATHLVNLRLQALGEPNFVIGVSTAVQAVGIVIAALCSCHLASVIGGRRAIVIAMLVASVSIVMMGLLSDLWLIGLLRLTFALGVAVLVTLVSYFVLARRSRHSMQIGWYATALAAGTASGPVLVGIMGVQSIQVFVLCGILFPIGAIPALTQSRLEERTKRVPFSMYVSILRVVPVAFVCAAIYGMIDNGGLTLLSIYGVALGHSLVASTSLATFAMIGTVALQLPLVRCAERYQLTSVLALCSVGSVAILLSLPFVLGDTLNSILTLLTLVLLLGGLIEGFHTIGLIYLYRYCAGGGLAVANGCFVAVGGFGEVIGPIVTGIGMQRFGPHGLILTLVTVIASCLVFIVSGRGQSICPNRHSG